MMACPTAEMCALAVQPMAPHNNQLPAQAMAITRNGGRVGPSINCPYRPPSSGATVKRVTCTDDLHCLVYATEQSSSRASASAMVLSTNDGGGSWAKAGTLPSPRP